MRLRGPKGSPLSVGWLSEEKAPSLLQCLSLSPLGSPVLDAVVWNGWFVMHSHFGGFTAVLPSRTKILYIYLDR